MFLTILLVLLNIFVSITECSGIETNSTFQIPQYWPALKLLDTNYIEHVFYNHAINTKDHCGDSFLMAVIQIDQTITTQSHNWQLSSTTYTEKDKISTVIILLQKGANPALMGASGSTALEQAVLKKYKKISLMLLDSKYIKLYSSDLLNSCLMHARRNQMFVIAKRIENIRYQPAHFVISTNSTPKTTKKTNPK